MQVLCIRHAAAEEYDTFKLTGQPDDQRPLSEVGILKAKKSFQGLSNIIPNIQIITSSPLVRAVQTADLIQQVYPNAYQEVLVALSPAGSFPEILSYLQEHTKPSHTIVLVGHQPNLGELCSWLLSERKGSWLPFKKAGACLLEFEGQIKPGYGILRWMLTPNLLSQLVK